MLTTAETLHAAPIFVVGCGHSGSSITARLIGAHPNIWPIAGETKVAMRRDKACFSAACMAFQEEARFFGRSRWLEKTPRHILVMPFLLDSYETSRIVAVFRDPRDVCLSFKKRYGNVDIGISRYHEAAASLIPLIGHARVLLVQYEDLVENTVGFLMTVMSFLGEDFRECQLRYHEDPVSWYATSHEKPASELGKENHNQLRNWQINQPLFDGRGKWRSGLTSTELALIRSGLQSFADLLGYNLH
jgi:hypothetical protein